MRHDVICKNGSSVSKEQGSENLNLSEKQNLVLWFHSGLPKVVSKQSGKVALSAYSLTSFISSPWCSEKIRAVRLRIYFFVTQTRNTPMTV